MTTRNRIKAPKVELFTFVERASQCAATKSPNVALGHTALCLDGQFLDGASTDIENSFATRMQVEVVERDEQGFRILVDGGALAKRIAAMPNGDVELEVLNAFRLRVSSAVAPRRFEMNGMSHTDAPAAAQPPHPRSWVKIHAPDLRRLISNIRYAVNTDISSVTSSALFSWKTAGLDVVGTNGHRLMVASAANAEKRPSFADSLIPLAAMPHLIATLDWAERAAKKDSDAMVDVAIADNRLFVLSSVGTYSTKLRDGTFPPYQSVLVKPDEPGRIRTLVSRSDLIAAITAVRVASGNVGGVDFTIGDGKIVLHAKSPDTGDASDEVVCDYFGETRRIQLAHKYVTESLDAMTTEQVEFSINGGLDPLLTIPHHPPPSTPHINQTAIIMPMRT
jgi:DNA polymerase-3 subunit beta